MAYFRARNIGKVELTDERKAHILERHPEVKTYFKQLANIIADPEIIRRSRYDPKVLLFYRRVAPRKYLAVAVKTNEHNFILTAYLTDRLTHLTI